MFSTATYERRRAALRQRLGSGLVLLPGASDAAMRYKGNPYPFVQDGSFLYFFGIDEPDHLGLLDCDTGEARLFGPEDGLDDLIWHGPRPSLASRAERVGAVAEPISGLVAQLARARAQGRMIHFPPPYRGTGTLFLAELLDRAPTTVKVAASPALIDAVVAIREIKEPDEVAEMERALEVTAAMHAAAMRSIRPGTVESAVVGEMEAVAARGRRRFAYPPILTRRGDILHNFRHEGRLERGDLVINDSGATSSLGYCSDVTRTVPVGGRFEEPARDVYQLVLAAQEQAIAAIRPGVAYRDIHLLAARVIAEGMVAMGLFRGDPGELVADGAHALVFPHGLGHQIGLDTHDMESLGEDRVGYAPGFARSTQTGLSTLRLAKPLRKGMVVTVEPGVYFISPLIERWAAEGRFGDRINWSAVRTLVGLGGVRIEDDVLVTKSGGRVLGPPIPKSVDAVEALTREGGAASLRPKGPKG